MSTFNFREPGEFGEGATMDVKSDLSELLERVKSATGPGRELDAFIGWHADGWASEICPEPKHVALLVAKNGLGVPAYTASVDAALAFAGRALPGWVVADLRQNSRYAGDLWGCALSVYFGSNPTMTKSASSGYDFPCAPLAIIAATLTALGAE